MNDLSSDEEDEAELLEQEEPDAYDEAFEKLREQKMRYWLLLYTGLTMSLYQPHYVSVLASLRLYTGLTMSLYWPHYVSILASLW